MVCYLNSLHAGNFLCLSCHLLTYFKIIFFLTNISGTLLESDPDEVQRFVSPDLR